MNLSVNLYYNKPNYLLIKHIYKYLEMSKLLRVQICLFTEVSKNT